MHVCLWLFVNRNAGFYGFKVICFVFVMSVNQANRYLQKKIEHVIVLHVKTVSPPNIGYLNCSKLICKI